MNKISKCIESIKQGIDQSKTKLQLTSAQSKTAGAMIDIVSRWGYVFNMGETGAGKSYMCLDVANRLLNENIFIICPATVTTSWQELKSKYISKDFKIISYDKFRGSSKHNNSDFVTINSDGTFIAKKYLEACVDTGVTFIFDECHKLKNDSLQKGVSSFVLNYSISRSEKTKIIFASGTLMDNEECSKNFFELIGIRRGEILQKCALIDPESTNACREESDFVLFKEVILKNTSVFCAAYKPEVNVMNCFFDLNESVEIFEGMIDKLEEYTTKKFNAATRASFTKDCITIELLKVGIFVEAAKTELDKGHKVVLIFNFIEPLERCSELLRGYSPLIFRGSTSTKRRREYLNLFQDDSSGRSLIIGNMQVLAEGIDLDDKTGIYKRMVFASPNYSMIRTHQLTNRFSRMDTMTIADVHWVYANQGQKEKNIIEALKNKSKVISSITDIKRKSDLI